MNEPTLPSRVLENAVTEIAKLPGIGRKTALRLALYLLSRDKEVGLKLAEAINALVSEIKTCRECHNISESDLCAICSDPKRDATRLCVVEDVRDVLAIENTGQYRGKYHVLGGLINPMAGIGPSDIAVSDLPDRIRQTGVQELIIALPSTAEGDTTAFFVFKKTRDLSIHITTLARGVAVGEELEYADEITLARSIQFRIPFETSIKS